MEYIQRVLGLDVARADWKGREKLPYFMLESYHFEEVSIAGYSCLFILLININASIRSLFVV